MHLPRLTTAAAALALMAPAAMAQPPAPRPAPTASSPAPGQDAAQLRQLGRQLDRMPTPLDSPQDFQDAARMAFMIADADNSGTISKEEATDAANILVGGLFFAADGDGNGAVTQQEAQQIRQKIAERQPLLRLLVQQARRDGANQNNPFRGMADLLDGNNDKQLQATEVRNAVQTAVEGLYAAADTNRDSEMSPAEVNAAALALAQAAGQAAFQLADRDNNGAVSQEEFQQALMEPANLIFGTVDANKDGQISADEARQAQSIVINQLMPRVPNPRGNAPVPDINVGPGQPQPAGRPAAGQPAPESPPRTLPGVIAPSTGTTPGGEPPR